MELLKERIAGGINDTFEAVKGIPDRIGEKMSELFIPKESPFDRVKSLFYEKFPIIEQVSELSSLLFSPVEEEAPSFTFSFSGYHGFSGDVSILSLDWYEPFRGAVRTLLSCFIWGATLLKVMKKIPSILGGI